MSNRSRFCPPFAQRQGDGSVLTQTFQRMGQTKKADRQLSHCVCAQPTGDSGHLSTGLPRCCVSRSEARRSGRFARDCRCQDSDLRDRQSSACAMSRGLLWCDGATADAASDQQPTLCANGENTIRCVHGALRCARQLLGRAPLSPRLRQPHGG